MVVIQSAAAEIRRGKKKKEKRKKETTGQKYNGLPYSIGWPYTATVYAMFQKNSHFGCWS